MLKLTRNVANDTYGIEGITEEQVDMLHGFFFGGSEVQKAMSNVADMLRPKDPTLGILDNLERERTEQELAADEAQKLFMELARITDPAMR